MSDNKDAAAPLGYSEIFSIQNSVGDPIPAFDQHPEEGSEGSSPVNRQHAGDVLPHQPCGPQAISKSSKLDSEVATRIIQSRSSACDGEGLARCSSGQKVDCSHIVGSYSGEVTCVDDVAVSRQVNNVADRCGAALGFLPVGRIMRAGHDDGPRCAVARAQKPAAEGIDLGEHDGRPAERLPRNRDGFDARADGEVSHAALRGVGLLTSA